MFIKLQPVAAESLDRITPDISLENVRVVLLANPVGAQKNLIRTVVSFDCINRTKLERTLDMRDAKGLVSEFVPRCHDGADWRFNHYYESGDSLSCSSVPTRTYLSIPASSTNILMAHLILDSPALMQAEGSTAAQPPVDSNSDQWKFSYRAQRADLKHERELHFVIGEGPASVRKE